MLHCIIHQENLCEKISNSDPNNVILTLTKIVSLFVARSATTHRKFRSLLEEMKSAHHDSPLHCSCKWLSRNKVPLMFVECLVEIRTFMIGQGKTYTELEDEKWLIKVMFLADITTHFNKLNIRLQGTGQIVMCLFEIWKGFVSKLNVQTATFRCFEHLKVFSLDR